jgi:electron transfer flavoprotein alpha subunit
VAKSVAAVQGVTKVLVVKDDVFAQPIAENLTPAILAAQKQTKSTHILAAHSAFGKNTLPRVAALLDVAAISDVMEVVGDDTFVRPIYAGSINNNDVKCLHGCQETPLVPSRPRIPSKF